MPSTSESPSAPFWMRRVGGCRELLFNGDEKLRRIERDGRDSLAIVVNL